MTTLDYILVAVYFAAFIAVVRWCVRFVKSQQNNPLDRGTNAEKLPSDIQRKQRRAGKLSKAERKKR